MKTIILGGENVEAMVKRTVPAWGRICKAQMVILDKSLNDMCTESGFSRSYVSGIMNGRIYGPPEAIEKISSTLNVDPKLYGAAG